VRAHSEPQELTLFGANFCPFVQRVWILLEYKRIPYQYVECDPYNKPKALMDINPRGLVPALKIGDNGERLGESTVIMEYLEERFSSPGTPSLLPPLSEPYQRARVRLAADNVNRNIVPCFYRYLLNQDSEKQAECAQEFLENLIKFVESMDDEGPFWGGKDLGWVDVMIAPWILRAKNVLRHYRGFVLPTEPGSRYKKWEAAVLDHPAVRATTSTDQLYIDNYLRYAKNVPNTSEVADRLNSGRGLP